MKTTLLNLILILTSLFFALNAQLTKSTQTTSASNQANTYVIQSGTITKTIEIKTSGTLTSLLKSTDKVKISNLKLIGNIDLRDFEVIRKGLPALKTLDLSEVKIVGQEQTLENQLPDYCLISIENLTKLILPVNLTSIGKSALAYTKNLNELIFPETLKHINEGAFNFSGIKKVYIPDSLSTSDLSKLSWCQNLTQISVSANSKKFIVQNDILFSKDLDTLYLCPRTKKMVFSDIGIDKIQNLKVINKHAFNYCKGLSGIVVFPSQLEIIEDYAFYNCDGLTGTLSLPASIKKIGKEAFNGCRGFTGELKIPSGLKEIENGAFALCSGLTGVLSIPKGITKIGFRSFYWCSGINGLILPDGLNEIDDNAFAKCTGLAGKLEVPRSVKRIGKEAFKSCRNLTRINILVKKNVNDPNLNGCYIDTEAFMGCEYSVYVGNKPNL
jgi:hypothetical protein